MDRTGPLLVAFCALSLLAACGERRDAPVQPPPLALAPDTSMMGAGPPGSVAGAVLANCGLRTLADEALQRINAARASGWRCGRRTMGAAGPLKWDGSLHSAASAHAWDMARRNYFEHRSPEGADVASRVAASHYRWKSVGENIAGGDRSVGEVMQSWLASPDHCENIMDPKYVDVAVACVAQPGTEFGTYWTMVLGRK